MTPAEKLQALQADVPAFAGAGAEAVLAELPEWGSLTILLVVVHVEERHRLTLSGARIRACRTVGDLLRLIP